MTAKYARRIEVDVPAGRERAAIDPLCKKMRRERMAHTRSSTRKTGTRPADERGLPPRSRPTKSSPVASPRGDTRAPRKHLLRRIRNAGVGGARCALRGVGFAVRTFGRTTGAIWSLAAGVARLPFSFATFAVGQTVTLMMLFAVVYALRNGLNVAGLVKTLWGVSGTAWNWVVANRQTAIDAFAQAATAVSQGATAARTFVQARLVGGTSAVSQSLGVTQSLVPESLGVTQSLVPESLVTQSLIPESLGVTRSLIPSVQTYFPAQAPCVTNMNLSQFKDALKTVRADVMFGNLKWQGLVSLLRQCSAKALECGPGTRAREVYENCTAFFHAYLGTPARA